MLLHLVFWLSAAWLSWVYFGYGLWLRTRPSVQRPLMRPAEQPDMTVVLTVHNAEALLLGRLENILACEYPADRLEIIVASDGSTDRTVALARSLASDVPIRTVDLPRAGKSVAQNQAIEMATGDIIVLTDVDVAFEPDCLTALALAFAVPDVGCATAHVLMRQDNGAIARSQGLYWRYELGLRAAETRAGMLAVASGGAMAVRRSLFRPLPANIGDDCHIPLAIVSDGYRVVHVEDAVALDTMRSSLRGEFGGRVRMTARNWQGTWLFPRLLAPWHTPGFAVALWSHKVMRWLGAFALASMLSTGLVSLIAGNGLALEGLFTAIYILATLAGALAHEFGLRIPLVGAIFSFGVANVGFAVGLLTAWFGRRITTYAPAHAHGQKTSTY